MATNKMNQEFQKRMKDGVASEEEQLRNIQRVKQSIMKHKYGVSLEKNKGELEDNGR